jgi:general stress protein 26
MANPTLKDIAEKMKGIDIAILSTHTEGGKIANRPMSNNGDVSYTGDSYFFALGSTRTVADIGCDPKVALGYSGKAGFFSNAGVYIAIEGKADIIRDKSAFKAHWNPDLDTWFERGIDTPDLVLIHVRAERITCWDQGKEVNVTV